MEGRDNLYSQFVAGAKVLLPLAALGLLSTLFLFARGSGGPTEIPYAEIEEIAREPRVASPAFAGITDDGSTVSVTARTMTPLDGRPDAFELAEPRAEIAAPDGSTVDIASGAGRIDGRDRIATLSGLAQVATSSGYAMETAGLTADLGSGTVTSDGRLEIRAPYGDLTAGRMTISDPGDGNGARMLFSEGVRLLYDPQSRGAPSP